MRRGFLLVLMVSTSLWIARAQTPATIYPALAWEKADAVRAGWSSEKLAEARRYFDGLASGSAVVVDRGRVVAEWGDPAKRVKLSSVRKSFLSALYGIHVRAGRLDLSKTLAQLGIDDQPPLTTIEKTATLRMLLQARSGVYHPYVGGLIADREAMPARGSHPPGSFWYYNNWDFNASGTVFEQQLHLKIATEFRDRIAAPVQMQDFRLEDMHYFGGTTQTAAVEQSVHPAYHFSMTARDMARFGYLFLRAGSWNGRQLIPADWVTESTSSYSDTGGGGGYGYFWWVNGFPGVSVANYSARGALGKYIVVVPERDLVVVYQNQTEFPDDAAAYEPSQLQRLPNVSAEQMGGLLSRLLDAQATSTPVRTQLAPPPEARQAAAPTGRLRVGLYPGSPTSMIRDRASGETRGLAFDLGREFARRLNVPFEPIEFPQIANVLDALKLGQVDFTVTNASPARARDVDFTSPILGVELGYLVPAGSPIATLADVDRPGVRVGVTAGGSSHSTLSREFKHAAVVPAQTLAIAVEMFSGRTIDAYATNKAVLFEMAGQSPGSRVLDGRWGIEHFAMAIPKGRDQALAAASRFADEARSTGLVERAAGRAGLRGIVETK